MSQGLQPETEAMSSEAVSLPSVERLRMDGVWKRFGPTQALAGVNLSVKVGEVHTLVGENGAGKSTLMKILSGALQSDSGTILLNSQPFTPHTPLEALRSGVAMIYQELNLAPDISVEENILLGAEPHRWGWLDRAGRSSRARAALKELGHDDIPLDVPVGTLTLAQQQVVEIARALTGNPQVLVMDEPTSSLSQRDAENLFRVIDRLKERGVSVIYITHFLEECQQVCDRFTVLRDGCTVGSGEMDGTKLDGIIRLMVGREITEIYPRSVRTPGDPVLELKQVRGRVKPRSVTLTLRAGEILGIAGLVGAGRTETLRACFGLDHLEAGVVAVWSKESSRGSPARRLLQGIGLLSENRKEEGLMLNRSIADNLMLSCFGTLARFGFVSDRRQRQIAVRLLDRLDIRANGPEQAAGDLSGGNQQKVAIGRLLHHDARILLLDEPTRGIDVGSKAQIYRLMDELAQQGRSVLFVSSYLPELMGVCDRIGVMCKGELVDTRPVPQWTEPEIIRVAVGQGAFAEES